MNEPILNNYIWAMTLLTLAIALGSLLLWLNQSQRKRLHFGTDQTKLLPWQITWVDLGIFIFAMFVAVFACQSIVSVWIPDVPEDDSVLLNPSIAIISILTLQLPILIVYYAFQKFYSSDYALQLSSQKSHWFNDFKSSFLTFIQYLPLIWLCSIVWSFVLSILQELSWIEEFPIQPIIELLSQDLPLLQVLLIASFAIILAPIVEEILFRGCFYRFLKGKFSILLAQIISAICFAIVHGNLAAFLPLTLIGFILVRIYESSGSIKQAIFFHALFNANSFLFMTLIKLSGIPLE